MAPSVTIWRIHHCGRQIERLQQREEGARRAETTFNPVGAGICKTPRVLMFLQSLGEPRMIVSPVEPEGRIRGDW
jgi:hypothetical protein